MKFREGKIKIRQAARVTVQMMALHNQRMAKLPGTKIQLEDKLGKSQNSKLFEKLQGQHNISKGTWTQTLPHSILHDKRAFVPSYKMEKGRQTSL